MRVEPDGPVPCDLGLWGEAPGWDEQIQGLGFVGKAGQQLWSDMKRFTGLSRRDFYVSNIVKEGLPKNRDPKPEEISRALPEFLDELELVKPRIVVTAGAFATRAMLGDVKMADVHGIPHYTEVAGHRYICMPIYHPAAGLHNKGFLAAFAYDLGRFNALLNDDIEPWLEGTPGHSEWLAKAPRPRQVGISDVNVIAVDTEGWADCPKMLSFCGNGIDAFVIPVQATVALAWFRQWIADKIVVMHNGVHDVPVLRAMGVHSFSSYHDTQVLAYHDIMRTGSGILEAESQNLGTLAYRECGLRLGELSDIKGVDYSTQTIPYTDEVMQYAGEDVIATRRLLAVYLKRGLVGSKPYQIDMGQVALVEQMMTNGIPFNLDAAMDYYGEVLDKLEVVTTDLQKTAARYGNREFNPGSHPQVRELLTKRIGLRIRKRTKGGLASTNERALADHQHEPFVKKLQEHRELNKLRGTYIEPLLEELS